MAMILDKQATNKGLDVVCEPTSVLDKGTGNAAPDANVLESKTVCVQTTRFGVIEVETDLILTFPEGLIGFETCQRYFVARHEEGSSFRWLQSVDSPAVAFPIVEPREFRPDYAPTISDTDARALGLEPTTPTLLFVVVTIPPGNPRGMTANLLGPLVINGLTKCGKQVIIQDEGYTTRHEIVEELARAANFAVAPVKTGTQKATRIADLGRDRPAQRTA